MEMENMSKGQQPDTEHIYSAYNKYVYEISNKKSYSMKIPIFYHRNLRIHICKIMK